MTASLRESRFPSELAFDSIAESYDETFTRSVIGRAQRAQVWRALASTFKKGDSVLELNCGTGEDALFLARRGVSVLACDVSGEMIRIARQRHAAEVPRLPVRFEQLANEELHLLESHAVFEGVFSNFSGMNCVADLRGVARQMAQHMAVGAPALLCMSTRICAWDTLWYLGHGEPRRAFRRWPGEAKATVNGYELQVKYPTVRELRWLFAPWFALRSYVGIGVFVPPSYGEAWAEKNGGLLAVLSRLDRLFGHAPGLRVLGDHVLLHFERTAV